MTHHFIKNRDIILFGLQSWSSEIAFNLKDMAFELARENRVLFVNRALDRRTAIKNIFSGSKNEEYTGDGLEKITDRLWVFHPHITLESVNWSPFYFMFDYFNRINTRNLAGEIGKAVSGLGFSDCLLINDNDFFRGLYLGEFLGIGDTVFYLRDFLTLQPYFKKFGARCEKLMIEKARLVAANSMFLARYARQWNPNSVYIGQGFSRQNFPGGNPPEPEDLEKIPLPRIGYFGALTALRLDTDLIGFISEALPEMSIVLAGPVDNDFLKSSLTGRKNIFFLGPKKPEETESYLRHFTVCINPQKINPQTAGNYPRKIDEYLYCGKPVVATDTPAMELFREYVYLSRDRQEFIVNIRKAVEESRSPSEDRIRRKIEFARSHSWENSVGALGDAYFSLKKDSGEPRE